MISRRGACAPSARPKQADWMDLFERAGEAEINTQAQLMDGGANTNASTNLGECILPVIPLFFAV